MREISPSSDCPSLACIRARTSSKPAPGSCNRELAGQSGLFERPVFHAEARITAAASRTAPTAQTSRCGQSRENAGITAGSGLLAIDQPHRELVRLDPAFIVVSMVIAVAVIAGAEAIFGQRSACDMGARSAQP